MSTRHLRLDKDGVWEQLGSPAVAAPIEPKQPAPTKGKRWRDIPRGWATRPNSTPSFVDPDFDEGF